MFFEYSNILQINIIKVQQNFFYLPIFLYRMQRVTILWCELLFLPWFYTHLQKFLLSFIKKPNIKHLCDLSSIKQTLPVQGSVSVTPRSPAVDTHQVSDNPEYFDVGLLQEKTLGDEDTFRSLANQTQLCGRSRDQRFQSLTHGERSLKILINNQTV